MSLWNSSHWSPARRKHLSSVTALAVIATLLLGACAASTSSPGASSAPNGGTASEQATATPTLAPTATPSPTATPTSSVPLSQRIYAASLGNVYSLNIATGAVLWKYNGVDTDYTPVYSGSAVYFVSNDTTVIEAADAMTGAILWSHPLSGSIASFAVDAGKVFVAFGNTVAAINASNGDTLWHLNVKPPKTPGGVSQIFTYNGVIYVGLPDLLLHAISEANGKTLWTVAQAGYGTPLLVSQGRLIVTYTCGAFPFFILIDWYNICAGALSATSGAHLWSTQIGVTSCFFLFIGCSGGSVFFGGDLYGITANGTRLYLAVQNYYSTSSSAFYNIQDLDAISVNSGGTYWSYTIPGSDQGKSTYHTFTLEKVDGTAAYYESDAGALTALRLSNLKPMWTFNIPGGQTNHFFEIAGVLYVLSTQSNLIAVSTSNGKVLWSAPLT